MFRIRIRIIMVCVFLYTFCFVRYFWFWLKSSRVRTRCLCTASGSLSISVVHCCAASTAANISSLNWSIGVNRSASDAGVGAFDRSSSVTRTLSNYFFKCDSILFIIAVCVSDSVFIAHSYNFFASVSTPLEHLRTALCHAKLQKSAIRRQSHVFFWIGTTRWIFS